MLFYKYDLIWSAADGRCHSNHLMCITNNYHRFSAYVPDCFSYNKKGHARFQICNPFYLFNIQYKELYLRGWNYWQQSYLASAKLNLRTMILILKLYMFALLLYLDYLSGVQANSNPIVVQEGLMDSLRFLFY